MTCACCQGACCNGTTCTQKNKADCESGGGVWHGSGVSCTPNLCGPCCVIDGVAHYDITEANCVSYCEPAQPQFFDQTTLPTEADCGKTLCFLFYENPDETWGPCPDGWSGLPGPLGSCYRYICVSDCVDCTFAGITEKSGQTSCSGLCGTWHTATWYTTCADYVGPMALSVGPGAELKALLAAFGIQSSPTCKCNQMATMMNLWGPDECLKHIEEIVDVMEEEARKRSLPFLRGIGRLMVRKAVRRARGQ